MLCKTGQNYFGSETFTYCTFNARNSRLYNKLKGIYTYAILAVKCLIKSGYSINLSSLSKHFASFTTTRLNLAPIVV